jgi:hypothetical protein
MKRFGCAIGYSIVCLSLLANGQSGGDRDNRSEATRVQEEKSAQQRRGKQGETRASTPQPNIAFAVSNDQPLIYPDSFYWLPDEHTTIMPAAAFQNYLPPPGQPGPHDFFVAMSNCVAPGVELRPRQCENGKVGKLYGGAFVLRSSDFKNFSLTPGFGNANHGRAVFWSPNEPGKCGYKTVTHFDEQYAAPGSVLQDPTLPPGNLIMIYEAEIHCPPAPQGMAAGWVSVGVTRSADGGRTWPAPVPRRGMENNWLDYGDDRYAGITIPGSPGNKVYQKFFGDVLPSAFIDDMDPSGNFYLYVTYQFTGSPDNPNPDAKLHIARAWLGDRSGRREVGQLQFHKWYRGRWSAEIRGGPEDGVMPACTASFGEGNAQVSYNDALGHYVMTFVCSSYTCPTKNNCYAYQDSLYYSTATSLERQDWTTPQLIQNSTHPRGTASVAMIMDGGYPSFVSPGCDQGHIGLSGSVFLLSGNPLGDRRFVSREFTIRPLGPLPPREEGALANGCRPHRLEGVRPRREE